MLQRPEVNLILPDIYEGIFDPYRYKVFYGGRGSTKSHSIARYLIASSIQSRQRILCAREHQNSIQESVHRLMSDLIRENNLAGYFTIANTSIKSMCGSEFLFKGLSQNTDSIRSTEGVDKCWVEEAEKVSERSWELLIPTIRKPGSEILVSFNPDDELAPTYQRFVVNTPPDTLIKKVNYTDVPEFFPDVLRTEMENMKRTDYERYLHVWEGQPRSESDAQIFKGKFVSQLFETSHLAQFMYGVDWGFGIDPCHIVRMYIKDNVLYIDYDAEGYGLDLKDVPTLFRNVPGSDTHPLWCDESRPETISFFTMPENGRFDCRPAPKWKGSIEDGIEHIRSYDKVVIHPRCKATLWSFSKYSYKIDPHTDKVMPIIVDKYNHGTDAVRYGLCTRIQRRTTIFDRGVTR